MGKFMEGWDWERIYHTWDMRLSDFGVSPKPLFKKINVHDPKYPTDRPHSLTWCSIKAIPGYHLELQRHYDLLPGTIGPIRNYSHRKGEFVTLEYLWEYREQPQKVAAILISASLFYRLESTRKRYSKLWPSQHCVHQIANLALAKYNQEQFPWHYSSTEVLPFSRPDWEHKITDINGVVRFLAEEHASILSKYQPMVIYFQSRRDPFIENQLHIEYEQEKKDRVRLQKKWELENKSKQLREQQLKRDHPRYGEWSSITREELESLVWSMPTVQVANLFGISDSAVGKRCRTLNIVKPPRGFWAKVQSNAIPHPNGKPQNNI